MEFRTFTIDSDLVEPVRQELASRVRLRFTIAPRPWWRFWQLDAAVQVSGPAAALDDAERVLRDMHLNLERSRAW